MIDLEKKAPIEEIIKRYPIGSKVKLSRAALTLLINVWKPDINAIIDEDWEVIDYYYLIGSRKKAIVGTIIGMPFDTFKKVQPSALFGSDIYGNIEKTIKAGACSAKLVEYDNAKRHLCFLVLTDWQDGRYREEQGDVPEDIPEIDFAGDFF